MTCICLSLLLTPRANPNPNPNPERMSEPDYYWLVEQVVNNFFVIIILLLYNPNAKLQMGFPFHKRTSDMRDEADPELQVWMDGCIDRMDACMDGWVEMNSHAKYGSYYESTTRVGLVLLVQAKTKKIRWMD